MADTTTQGTQATPGSGPSYTLAPRAARPEASSGGWLRRVLVAVFVLAIIAGGAWGAAQLFTTSARDPFAALLTAPVQRGNFLVTVTEDGNVESAVNIDIKCEVAGGTAILWIVEDGKEVKKGDKIIELDSSALEEQINQQKIAFEKARAAKIQSEKDYAAAVLAVDEYLKGTYVMELQDQESQITIALENLRTAQNTLEHGERMFRKGYISALDLESQRFSVQRAQLDLDSAKTSKDVLEKYTKVKTVQDLESKRDSAEAQMRSEAASFALEESRLKRLEAQLERCVILAPADGMVVYANEKGGRFGGSQQAQIEEGAMVRERQTIVRLPDLSKMQVKVNVHESKIDMLGRAMKRASAAGEQLPARIRILDRVLDGHLTNIANQPEATSWFSGNVKEYATTISIVGTPEGLRPGMTAECEILVEDLSNVLMVPVASVVELSTGYCAWVRAGQKLEKRPLVLGSTNDQFVEIKDGLTEGERVVLNPRAMVQEARSSKEDRSQQKDKKEFAKSKKMAPGEGDGQQSGAPGSPPGDGAAGGPPAARPDGGTGGGPGGPGAGARGGSGGGRRGSMNLMQFDKDGDGKVSRDEAPEQMQSFFDRMDANGDGFIDSAEVNALRQRMRSGDGGAGGPGGGGPGGP